MPRAEGALIVLENSHISAKLHAYWRRDAYNERIGWLNPNPLLVQEMLGGRWLTADFHAGDVVCFDIKLIHATLDNVTPSGLCRLSSDTRYLLEGDALNDRWNGDIRNPLGGVQRAFFPGLHQGSDGTDCQGDWKDVDDLGRLKRRRTRRPAAE